VPQRSNESKNVAISKWVRAGLASGDPAHLSEDSVTTNCGVCEICSSRVGEKFLVHDFLQSVVW
jgi:hypothetical protein